MQTEFRMDLRLSDRLSRVALSLAVAALCAWFFGLHLLGQFPWNKIPHEAGFWVRYLLIFGSVFFISYFALRSLYWIRSLFDWGVVLRIDDEGVYFREKFRETIPWRNIKAYEIESMPYGHIVHLQIDRPEKYVKRPLRLLGIRVLAEEEKGPDWTSFTTNGLDAISEQICRIFEQRWQEARGAAHV